ncbi:hypothetical protein IQ241_17725 [Romeria aff. gracilis LEGE 07310]|uniref:Bacterial cell division membrane protein n=1 Tax=Vasconcelosia minhoensis LEGE 07310 TaxID=915328 RepID=A0A8J7DP49_9CYAN|nr:hormogonium polysaccharide biosynthesis protein HpsL [Romeria gracilis]MBE9079115.1 hypothetical protein [Romeria aff. gracilis LEGE 07310]
MAKKRPPKKQAKKRSKKRRTRDRAGQTETLSPKAQMLQKRAAASARQQVIKDIASTVFGTTLLGLVVGLLVEPKLGIALVAALSSLILSFKYQRQALYALIIYVPFAGTVVYALGGSAILQLAKDLFYIPALLGVVQFCRKNRLPLVIPAAIKLPLGLLLTLVLLTLLLVNAPQQFQSEGEQPIIMGILGLKILLGYLPLIACIYYLIRTSKDLYFLLRLQVVLVLVACSLGMIQYLMLKTGICSATAGTGEELFRASTAARCLVGGSLLYAPGEGQIRLPGTFAAPWQWGWFLISSAFFSFGTTFNDRSPFWRLLGLISLVAVMIMSVISGQRIALLLVPSAIVLLSVLTGQIANLKRFVPIAIVMGLILTFLIVRNPDVVQARINSFQSRWNASPPIGFIQNQFGQVMGEQEGIFGRGVGRATNATRTFGETVLLETYHPKLLYEIGPLGLLAVLMLYTTLTISTFRAYRATKDKYLRGYAASMWVFVLFISYFPYYYPLDVDPVGVYYWLAAGIALKLPEIDREEREAAEAFRAEAEGRSPRLKRRRKKTPEFV